MAFGVTLGDELIMAGLGGLPVSWQIGGDVIEGREDLTLTQIRALDKVTAAHDPARIPAPEVLPPRMFYNALAGKGWISESEAIDALADGTIPGTLATAISSMDLEVQYQVNMLLTGAVNLSRFPPLSDAVKLAFNLDDNELYDLWGYAWGLG